MCSPVERVAKWSRPRSIPTASSQGGNDSSSTSQEKVAYQWVASRLMVTVLMAQHILKYLAIDVLVCREGRLHRWQFCGLFGVPKTLAAHLVEGAALFQGAVIQFSTTAQHKQQGLLLRLGGIQAIAERFTRRSEE